ncbi:hypothetical protein [Chryseobacterium sp. JK1]|uniref:hypothetical protein n=1 Tax=Chryseobacterium sp. JK1 TaxID=874294 RepID=UPI003D6991D9
MAFIRLLFIDRFILALNIKRIIVPDYLGIANGKTFTLLLYFYKNLNEIINSKKKYSSNKKLNMDLSELILERKVGNISVGDHLKNTLDLDIISHQEGNIPGLYGLYLDDLFFEVIVLDDVIKGIYFDFTYEIKEPNTFECNGIKMILDDNTTLINLADHLKKMNIGFEIIEPTFESRKIRLEKYKSNFYFDNESDTLFKLTNSDFSPFMSKV